MGAITLSIKNEIAATAQRTTVNIRRLPASAGGFFNLKSLNFEIFKY